MWRDRYLPLLFVLLAIVAVYANSFENSFHFDDFHAITDNPSVRSLHNVARIFRDATAFSVLPANQTYRPVVTSSLALDYALGHGYNVFWFHLSTLLWFLLLVALLYLFAEQLFRRIAPSSPARWLALAVAAWFGLHPAMAETVNYIIQRGDLYCTLGCVAALWLYAARPRRRRYGIYLVPFALAMLSKPPASVFPFLLLLYVVLFEGVELTRAQRWRAGVLAVLPALGLDALLLWLQSAMTPRSYAPTILSPGAYRLIQPYVWLRYAGALFLPVHLNVDTDLQPASRLSIAVVCGIVFVAGLLVAVWLSSRTRQWHPVTFGLFWFIVTQLPTSLYALSEVENDHRMFFSFPGLMIAVIWAAYLSFERVARVLPQQERPAMVRAVAVVGVMGLCGYAYGAHRRNVVWRNEASLWADDVMKSPHNGRGLMNFGLTRMSAGDYTGAKALFERALPETPNYFTLEINLGIADGALADKGQPALQAVAEQHFRRALALAPGDDSPHTFYGRWLLEHGRVQEAIAQLQTAIALNRQRQMPRDLLMNAYAEAGDPADERALAQGTLAAMPGDEIAATVLHGAPLATAAPLAAPFIRASLEAYRAGQFQRSIEQAQDAVKVDPRSPEAWNNIGAGYGALRLWDKAIAAEEQALKFNPSLAIAQNNLRWFMAQKAAGSSGGPASPEPLTAAGWVDLSLALNQTGKYAESLSAARNALRLDPTSAEAWNNVAANDEALQRWDDAIDAAKRAIALRPDFELAKNNLHWSEQQKAMQH